jgi:hypothetical protein
MPDRFFSQESRQANPAGSNGQDGWGPDAIKMIDFSL